MTGLLRPTDAHVNKRTCVRSDSGSDAVVSIRRPYPRDMSETPVRRPRHLMDPNNPVRTVNNKALTHVQRWVVSVLAVFTIAHLSIGMVLASLIVQSTATASRVGLNVIAGMFGLVAVGVGFVIHRKSPVTPWLLLGLVPMVVGLWITLG